MPTSTGRLALVQPIGTDAVAELRESIAANAISLDASVIITEGTFSLRPTTGLVYGQSYYATDTGLWYFYTGSAWQTVLLAGPWVALTLATNVTADGTVTPSVRLDGDVVRFKGRLKNASGSSAGPQVATIPSGFRPLDTIDTEPWSFASGIALAFQTGGAIVDAGGSFPTGSFVDLTGITYMLS